MNPTDTNGLVNALLGAMLANGNWNHGYGDHDNHREVENGGLANFQSALQSNGINNTTIMAAIEGNEEALEAISKSLDLSTTQIQSVLAKVNDGILAMAGQFQLTAKDITMAIKDSQYDLSKQLAQCCCEMRLGQEQIKNDILANRAELTHEIHDQTAELLAKSTSDTQRILDKMCDTEIQNLRDQVKDAKEDAQTAVILAEVDKKIK